MDLSHLSDADLEKLSGGQPAHDFSSMSDDELEAIAKGQPLPKTSKLESLGRGLAQGATFNLADEGVGAYNAPLGAAKEIANKFGAGFDDEDVQNYKKNRDESRASFDKAQKDHPWLYGGGELGGALATALVPIGAAGKAAQAAENLTKTQKALAYLTSIGKVSGTGGALGGMNALGASKAEGGADLATDTLKGAKTGAEVGALLAAASPIAAHGASKLGGVAKGTARKAALNATGATGKQAAEFAPDAADQLLDRNLIRFGDSQKNIADRVGAASDEAAGNIDQALSGLDEQGVKVDANDIYNKIRAKINELKGDPSNADVVNHLEKELDNLLAATDVTGTDLNVSAAEKIKRGYNRKAGNWMDPEKGQAGKELYQAFRGSVEDSAQSADPALASLFDEGKKTYGLLAPIKEAAERRAATTAQSPAGGLLDLGSIFAGAKTGNPYLAVAAPVARRVVAPRIASSVAVGSNKLANLLLKSPRFQQMATSNPGAFRALVSNLATNVEKRALRVASHDEKPSFVSQPMDNKSAQQSFLEGN